MADSPRSIHGELTLDGSGRILFWSRAARELFGYDELPQNASLAQLVARPLDLATARVERVTARRANGETFACELALEPWRDGDRLFVHATIKADNASNAYHDAYVAATSLLACTSDFAAAAPLLLESLCATLGWEAAAVWLVSDDARGTLRSQAFWSAREMPDFRAATEKLELARGNGLPGQVWQSGEAAWIEDLSASREFLRFGSARREHLESAAAFPISDGTITIGVLELFGARHQRPEKLLLDLMLNLGALIGMFIARDRVMSALRASEEEYRSLVRMYNDSQQFAHVGSFERNLEDNSARWSDELYRLFGLAPQSCAPDFELVLAHIAPEDREPLRQAIERAVRNGDVIDMNCTIRRDDGTQRVVRARARAQRGDGETPPRLLGSILDVTADETAVRERLELQRELEESKRMASLGRLAATMAHEFNNVMTGISSFATQLMRRAVDDETHRSVTHIQQSLRRGKAITDQILRFTRSSQPQLAAVDVRAWLEAFMPEALALTSGRTTLEVADEGLFVRGDVAQLNQVLVNLVLNARDASAGAQPISIVARRASADNGVALLDLAVVDRGAGIPSEIRDRIFEPLFTTKRSGTGLGLAVVHQVVRAHRGTVRVRSEVGRGTEFHIVLPLVQAPAEQRERKTAVEVLLADDNEAFAIGMTELLELEGIRTRVVHRGGDIVRALEESLPDALILDIGLPDITGTDVYPTVAARWPRLPVIFISGHSRAVHVEQLLVQPHVAFLEKPFELAQLLGALERVVAAAA